MTIRANVKPNNPSRAEIELARIASLLSDDWFVWMNRHLNFDIPETGSNNISIQYASASFTIASMDCLSSNANREKLRLVATPTMAKLYGYRVANRWTKSRESKWKD